ncbi:MAG: pyrroline-5-carboxylate reductase [bacterium]|jgi:pyrroline-5-carboxylate reductase|nr:pyrroline-5-carboxylate reductase [bacterium]
MINKKIGIIGCGNMGGTIAQGLIKNNLFKKQNVFICDKDKKKIAHLKKEIKVKSICPSVELVKKADIIILAIKPKDFDQILQKISKAVGTKKLVISVAAGISTGHIEYFLGPVPVVRVMPNLAVVVATGMSAVCKGKFARGQHLLLTEKIFRSIGKTVVVPEPLMNAVTAVSGSGPAYIFEVMEDMIQAAMKAGLSKDVSEELVKQTVFGSAKMVIEGKDAPAVLRDRVTSPGGTTEAALKHMKQHHFAAVLIEAIQQAKRRAKELGR